MRLSKHLFVILACSLIISCGLIKTTYNNAPALVIWWLDDYFDFTAEQNLILKPALDRLHIWHRQQQLPHYVILLQSMQTSLENTELNTDETCEQLTAIRSSIYNLQIESIPIIVEIAPSLSDAQLARFQEKLDKRRDKWKSEWWQETKQEQLAVRLEKAEDFAQKVYGDLDDAQLTLLKQSLAQAEINPAMGHQEIKRRNDDAFQILNALKNPALTLAEKSQLVKGGFERIQKSPNHDYQTYADALRNHSCETIVNLHASTSAKQKLHAKNWLNDYMMQLTALQAV